MASRNGFASPLLVVGILAGVLAVMLAVAVKWAMVQSENAAEAKVAMESWRQTATDCSDATLDADKKAKKAQARAKLAMEKAQADSAAAQTEVSRLKSSMGQKATCQAAVAKVRDGLVK